MRRVGKSVCAALCALALVSCGESADEPDDESWYTPEPGTPEAIAHETGLARYLPTQPSSSTDLGDGVTSFEFDPADGPMCMRGAPYHASVRETSSRDLLIFLQGGGACWSDFCLAVTAAPEGIPAVDVLDTELAQNPFSDWDVVYLPYCDGSLFVGDRDHDEDGDGQPDRFHRGLYNLSAALTVARKRFPDPERVVLAGSSGGGFGTLWGAFLVRYLYPNAPLFVVNDAGVGVADPNDPAVVDRLMDEFGARDALPDDCSDCLREGHIVGVAKYLLDRDDNARVAAITSWYDFIITSVFLDVPPADFRDAVDEQTGYVHQAHPDTYRRFIFDGAAHTTLLGDPSGIIGNDLTAVELPPDILSDLAGLELGSLETASANGVMLSDWLVAMLAQDEGWADQTETPGTPPP